MKKSILNKFLIIFFIGIQLCWTDVFAAKDDLLLKDEGGKGYAPADIRKACEYFDTDGNGHISVEEIKSKSNDNSDKTDRYLTILRAFVGDNSLGSDSNKGFISKEDGGVNVELGKAVREEHNKRREEEGLEPISDTALDEYIGIREFYSPKKVGDSGTTGSNLENIMDSADEFVDEANDTANVKTSALQDFSNTFYGIFLAVATAVTVIVGIIIGIKYMVSSAGERANVKQMLVPYAVGCVVVYGSFGIWALVVSLLNNV